MGTSRFFLGGTMPAIKLICTGKLKESFFRDAFCEYQKRIGGYGNFEMLELQEIRLPDAPSEKEISIALNREGENIIKNIPKDAYVVALCVEGRQISSEQFAALFRERDASGKPKLCFIIGSSYGLSNQVKERANLKMSMSAMTFPHHLARIMLMEQIYRSYKIIEGSRYHK